MATPNPNPNPPRSSLRPKPSPPSSAARPKPPRRASRPSPVDAEHSRVRVAVRLRPRNAEEFSHDLDAHYIELQPEMKKLKLRKNNWSSETYKFDEIFTENASQKRVYVAVAKPVVESVLDGYNGTVMAYGQTGTGKTYTVGQLGKDDPSQRGIMVRAMEDILTYSVSGSYHISISYIQLYLESIQDLLDPEKNNLSIVDDPKTGDLSLPGASVVSLRDLDHFFQLLQIGEANRTATNTKLNTKSSRSHAILIIYIQRSVNENFEDQMSAKGDAYSCQGLPQVIKSKLLIVDLAGSERINKSGSEGHVLEEAKFINLSLTSLGKCINALAENSPHIPLRDSKLTRLLRDSFGGSARTSLVITIGPSTDHHAETTSTILFGQRAMKVVNMLKIKDEVDYESLCRKLESHIDHFTVEIERQHKINLDEKEHFKMKLKEYENALLQVEKNFTLKCESLSQENLRLKSENKGLVEALKVQEAHSNFLSDEINHLQMNLEKEQQSRNTSHEKELADTVLMYENKIINLGKQLDSEALKIQLAEAQKSDDGSKESVQEKNVIHELKLNLQDIQEVKERALTEILSLREKNEELLYEKTLLSEELKGTQEKLVKEEQQKKFLEDEFTKYKRLCFDVGVKLQLDFEMSWPY